MNASASSIDFDRPVPAAPIPEVREITPPITVMPPRAYTARPGELSASLSPVMLELHRQIELVASVDVPVLLLGESGVGKEFAARTLHARSDRVGRTFLKINCAALPSELLESELFGYEPGAFTGAVKSKPGLFELCDHGTILLDEIAEMPPSLQAKLLHVLQDKQFSRLGDRRLLTVDVRVIAATNVDIELALEQKTFRTDLYYRLNTITLRIPPLRERRQDIPQFVDYFIRVLSAELGCPPRPLSKCALEACLHYSWPGNIRELKSFICRHLVLQDDDALIDELFASDATERLGKSGGKPDRSGLKPRIASIRAQAERQMIEGCLRKNRWSRSETARALHISTKTLWNKMQQYGISDPSRRGEGHGEAQSESSKLDAGTSRAINGHAEPPEANGFDRLDAMGPRALARRRA